MFGCSPGASCESKYELCCSDLKVKIGQERLSAHKFVLAARSDVWSLANMSSVSELDLSGEN